MRRLHKRLLGEHLLCVAAKHANIREQNRCYVDFCARAENTMDSRELQRETGSAEGQEYEVRVTSNARPYGYFMADLQFKDIFQHFFSSKF